MLQPLVLALESEEALRSVSRARPPLVRGHPPPGALEREEKAGTPCSPESAGEAADWVRPLTSQDRVADALSSDSLVHSCNMFAELSCVPCMSRGGGRRGGRRKEGERERERSTNLSVRPEQLEIHSGTWDGRGSGEQRVPVGSQEPLRGLSPGAPPGTLRQSHNQRRAQLPAGSPRWLRGL